MAPAGLSIITSSFPEGSEAQPRAADLRGRGGGGFSLGMVVGGLLTAIGWRWVFFAPVVIGARCCWRWRGGVVPHDDAGGVRGAFDLGGAFASPRAMILLVFTVVRAPDADGLHGCRARGERRAAGRVRRDRAARAGAAVRLGILRSASLVRANVGTMLFIGAFMAFQFVAVLYLQELRGWSSVRPVSRLWCSGSTRSSPRRSTVAGAAVRLSSSAT